MFYSQHLKILGFILMLFLMSFEMNAGTRSMAFNEGWRFLESETIDGSQVTLDDSDWRDIDLPHDWSVEDLPENPEFVGPFNPKMEGGHDVGWLRGGTGWYRKHFTLDEADADATVYLYFDGVMVQSEVWVNGHSVGQHKYGYTPFYFDITPFLNGPDEKNVVAVKVVNPENHSRWFSGSGIYRDVSLMVLNPVHVDVWGVGVTTPDVNEQMASVDVALSVSNKTDRIQEIVAKVELYDPEGKRVSIGSTTLELSKSSSQETKVSLEVPNPKLWDIHSPYQYRAVVSLQKGDGLLDRCEQPFGIRTIEFTADRGFLLNGRSVLMKGGCVHHDNGLLGAKAFRDAEFRKVRLLKQNGYNAIRSAHNPPSKHLIDACDELGMLLIDESFDHWVKPKRPNDYHQFYKEWWEKDTRAMVMRSRNSPSVVMWSIGNEVQERADPEGLEIAREAIDLIRSIDPTRPVTLAFNGFWDNPDKEWDDGAPTFEQIDVGGYNYQMERYVSDHQKHPNRIMYGAESFPNQALQYWELVEALPYVTGDFVWTAWDYLGEATLGKAVYSDDPEMTREDLPFHDKWPHYHGDCGDFSITGHKKAQSYYRDIVWRESELEILVHEPIPAGQHEVVYYWGWPREFKSWSWPGAEGELLKVNVYTRFSSARLELNGVIIAEEPVSPETLTATFEVEYQPGELTAIAVEDGVEKARQSLTSSGTAVSVRVTPEIRTLKADRATLAFVKVLAVDANGDPVPYESLDLQVHVEGPAELLVAGNDHYLADGSFQDKRFRLHNGRGQLILRSTGEPGSAFIELISVGQKSEDSVSASVKARIEFE